MILIIDLDNTIYAQSRGVLKAIDRRMSAYMVEKLGFSAENADETRVSYWKTHGTTMKGLKADFGIDESDFLKYVHNLPVDNMLSQDTELKKLLDETKYPKFVFTNADYDHATSVLDSLGIREQFDFIFDVTGLDFVGKPCPESYATVERRIRTLLDGECHGVPSSSFVFFDDFPSYLKGAKMHGWTTVHVDETAELELIAPVRIGGAEPFIDYTIKTIHEFPDVIRLIETGENAERDV